MIADVDERAKAQPMRTFGASAPLKDLAGKFRSTHVAIADAKWRVLAWGAAA